MQFSIVNYQLNMSLDYYLGRRSLYEDESEDLPVIKSNRCLRDYGHTTSIIPMNMSRYDKTYHSYRELMCRLRNEFNEVNSHMRVNSSAICQVPNSIPSPLL